MGFLVWPQNQGGLFLLIWPQYRWLRVSQFGPQNWLLQFGDLGLKSTATVSPGLASKPVASGFLVWASKLAATVW
jgi:hypothetical protein